MTIAEIQVKLYNVRYMGDRTGQDRIGQDRTDKYTNEEF
jgi:hypothetical protein